MAKRRGVPDGSYPVGTFQTTCWTDIESIKTADPARKQRAAGVLYERYQGPIYCLLRHRGYRVEQAEDLAQDFFMYALEKALFEGADPARGRLRDLLSKSLNNYAANHHRRETARKRSPRGKTLSSEDCQAWNDVSSALSSDPAVAFQQAWVTNLLNQALAEVEDYYCSRGWVAHWQVFKARVLTPILDKGEAPSLAEICRIHGVEANKKASNMAVTVARCFQATFIRLLCETGVSESELEDEIRYLLSLFSDGSAA